jgi:hypothetical protein
MRASAFLDAEMKKANVTYAELVKRLKRHGLKETEAGITMKLKRGTFTAIFSLACVAALELEQMVLERDLDIHLSSRPNPARTFSISALIFSLENVWSQTPNSKNRNGAPPIAVPFHFLSPKSMTN